MDPYMDLEIITLTEVSQSEKDKCHVTLFIGGILKNDTNELIYKTKTDSDLKNELLVTSKGSVEGGGIVRKFEIDVYKLL